MISLCNLTSKLKNAIKSNQRYIYLPNTSFSLNIAKLLFVEGLISGVTKIESKNVIKVFDETKDLFFIKRNNVIGKKGGIKFAARCDPQNKNESRLKKIISIPGLFSPEKQNILEPEMVKCFKKLNK